MDYLRESLQLAAFSLMVALACAASGVHAALPDEIQVYTDDINKPGEFGMELHVNTTRRGTDRADYPGEVTTHRGWRITPEFSYGVSDDVDVGLYLPATYKDGNWSLGGYKLRAKWLPIRGDATGGGAFAGVNLELSNIVPKFESSRHNAELRFMLGHRSQDWLFAVNPAFGWALSASQEVPPPRNARFRAGYKVSRTVIEGVAAGVEYYNEKGRWGNFNPGDLQDKTLFLTLDVDRGPLPFNIGIGRGLNANTDKLTIKMIFDVPF